MLGPYLLTGGALFLADLVLFLSLTYASVAPAAAQAVSRGVGALIGFFAHQRYAFRHAGKRRRGLLSRGGGYGALMLVGVLLSPVVLSLMLWLSGERLLIAKLAAEAVMAAFNFVVLRWLFVGRPGHTGTP
ncbi:hypothetical protein CF68_12745 [Cupriavidus sp. SK-4]|uniref:GtrA family protein n=1 Tax=Cupriavidus sp. SK-4 TaxID=574750 RepID=UPI000452B0C3|nr:GtrA family protein [Cupriavidus sp. SK-4]EYS85228.1 hypothetical protein CF68_12745 [Cupriavidus sp. SK-4]